MIARSFCPRVSTSVAPAIPRSGPTATTYTSVNNDAYVADRSANAGFCLRRDYPRPQRRPGGGQLPWLRPSWIGGICRPVAVLEAVCTAENVAAARRAIAIGT